MSSPHGVARGRTPLCIEESLYLGDATRVTVRIEHHLRLRAVLPVHPDQPITAGTLATGYLDTGAIVAVAQARGTNG